MALSCGRKPLHATCKGSKAEQTRERILQVAADEMQRVGYRAMGLNEILKKLRMSKGALYHHFKSKLELGYAVLDEHFATQFQRTWVAAAKSKDPLQTKIERLHALADGMDLETLRCGCPVNSLANEMSALDEGFRLRIEQIYDGWRNKLTECFEQAQREGYMKTSVSAHDTAMFVITSIQGAIVVAKNAQNIELFTTSVRSVTNYLSTLQTCSGQQSSGYAKAS